MTHNPLITNDAVVLGILALILGAVFKTAHSSHPFWRKFYTYIPALLLCYFIPSLLNTFNVVDGHSSNVYYVASRFLLPACLVLLTISIDLKAILNLGPKALIMFLTGTLGIVIGGPIAILVMSAIVPEVIGVDGPDAVWRGMTTVAGSWIGGGQRARITTLIGSDLAELGVSYTEPWLFNKRLRMDIDLWTRQTSSNRDYDQKSIGGKILFTKKLPWQYWRHSVGYRIEEFDIDDIDESDYSQKFIDEEEGSELTSNLLYAITRDSRSSYTQPEYGSMVKLSSEFQSEAWGSYTNLYKLNLDAKKYYPIFKESIIKFSTRLGQVNGDDEKIFDRLFAGGTGTIRGFKPREVGPVDPKDENPVGGESLWVFTTEATTPLGDERIWGAVFIDGGNVWADPWDYDINEFNWSIGTGIRLKLPLGTFSLDYGYPIHEEQDHLDGGGRLHFNLGYRF